MDFAYGLMIVTPHHVVFDPLQLTVHLVDAVQNLLEVLCFFLGNAIGVLLFGLLLWLVRLGTLGLWLLLAHKIL